MTDAYRIFLAGMAVKATTLIADWTRLIESGLVEERDHLHWQDSIEGQQWVVDEVERLLSDADLLSAYARTNGEPGNPEADTLLAEIKRRGLPL